MSDENNEADDMYVIIVKAEQLEQESTNEQPKEYNEVDIKEEPEASGNISDVKPNHRYLSLLKSNLLKELGIKKVDDEYQPSDDEEYESLEYISNESTDEESTVKKRQSKKRKKHSTINKTTVQHLRDKYPNHSKDELIQELVNLMKAVRPPPLPENFFSLKDVNEYWCSVCGKVSISKPACARHFQEYHGIEHYQCYGCDRSYRSTWMLYRHEKRDCKSSDIELVLKARAFFLGKKGRNRPYLQRHLPFLAKINTGSLSEPKLLPDGLYGCKMCSAKFRNKTCLDSHERSHRGERPFQCHVCERAYTSLSGLKKHELCHQAPRFQCDTCGRKFKQKDTLITHLHTHGEPRFNCTECERRYSTRAALKLHVRAKHLNLPPPCACRLCPKRFRRMSELSLHMKRKHGVSILTRTMYFKKLPLMSNLEVQNAAVVLNSEQNE